MLIQLTGTRYYFRNFLVSQGLPLLASVLPIQDHDELVGALRPNMHHFVSDTWLDDITGNTDSKRLWKILFNPRKRKHVILSVACVSKAVSGCRF